MKTRKENGNRLTRHTIALGIARKFFDGMQFLSKSGERLEDLCLANSVKKHRFDRDTVFEFSDFSGIAITENAWDMVAWDPTRHSWVSIDDRGNLLFDCWVFKSDEE